MTKKTSFRFIQPMLCDIAAKQDADPVVASKITLGMGYFNRYRVVIFRSPMPTPFPGGLDFQLWRERKNHPGRHPKRIWCPIGPHQVAGITAKVFRRISQMMADCLMQAHSEIVDLDGVPVPWEYKPICQQIRACGGIIGWRTKLSGAISVLHDTWSAIEYGGNSMRLSALQSALQTAGFSEQELNSLMPAYIPGYGLLLKSSAYGRYLQIAQPPRHHTLEIIQNSLDPHSPGWTGPDHAATAIVSAIPADLIDHIVRRDGSLRWEALNLEHPNEQDVEWELIHNRLIPTDVLSQYPALLARYGL